jgi:aminomethyltransferase
MAKACFLETEHKNLEAQLIDYAGFDVPLHYGDPRAEHRSVRESAGVFDVSHLTIVDIEGLQAEDCLRYMLSNDVFKLQYPGRAQYSCMLNMDAGVLDDLMVYYLANGLYRLVFNAVTRDNVLAWLTMHMARFDASLSLRDDLVMFAISGPEVFAKLKAVLAPTEWAIMQTLRPKTTVAINDLFFSYTAYTGEKGVEVMVPEARAVELWRACIDANIQACGLYARDSLRLEAGLSCYGIDADIEHTPLECNLMHAVSIRSDRDFIGKGALLARQESNHPLLRAIILEADQPLCNFLPVYVAGLCGEVTSGGYSPTLQKGIGLARVPRLHSNTAEVEIDGQRIKAQLMSPQQMRRLIKTPLADPLVVNL